MIIFYEWFYTAAKIYKIAVANGEPAEGLAKLKTNPGAKYKLYWVFFLKLYFTENSIFILVKKVFVSTL